MIAGWSLGRWLLRALNLPATIHLAVGSVVLSSILFVMLAMKIAHLPVMLGLGFLCLVPLAFTPPRLRFQIPWYVAVPGLLYLPYALAPETQTDALNYHLTLATEALRSGGFPQRIGFYEVLPQGIETLFAFAYAIGRDSAAKLIHFVFFLATLPIIQQIAARCGAGHNSSLPAWFYALTPVVGMSAVCSFNDAAMVFFILCTFLIMLEWWERRDDRLLWIAGLCAGFCYALKFTGGLVAPIACLAAATRRNYKGAAILAATSAAVGAPWILRAAILTGNPFAPLLNSLFPNPFFHIQTEHSLGQYLRNYGGVTWLQVPGQLAIEGDLMQGLLGPAWLVMPIGLLALRQPWGRLLWAMGLLAGAPWLLNIGTRFLMPSLPFLAIALMLTIPRVPAILLCVAHGFLSLPVVLAVYTPANAWVLPAAAPWRAALRIEPTATYLGRSSEDWNISRILLAQTNPSHRIFDMANAPAAITDRTLINAWQHPLGDQLVQVLQTGATTEHGWMVERSANFPEQLVDAIRLTFDGEVPQPVVIYEIALQRPDGAVVEPSSLWSLASTPNIWESPLALDRSLVTAWSTWQPVRRNMSYQVELPASERIAAIRIISQRDTAALMFVLHLRTPQGWSPVPVSKPIPRAALNLRIPAMKHFKQHGITHILGQYGDDGLGRLTNDLLSRKRDWNVQLIHEYKGIVLFRIR